MCTCFVAIEKINYWSTKALLVTLIDFPSISPSTFSLFGSKGSIVYTYVDKGQVHPAEDRIIRVPLWSLPGAPAQSHGLTEPPVGPIPCWRGCTGLLLWVGWQSGAGAFTEILLPYKV